MYSQKDIEQTLNEYNYFIDSVTLSNFIKNWKIEAIYEDEDNVEFYDNMAISKLKKGISLKSQGFSNDQIIYHINKLLPEKLAQKEEEKKSKNPVIQQQNSEMKNVTIDVTNQTLQMLADSVAQRITGDIQEKIMGSDFVKQLLEDNSLKKDNEVLAHKIEELTEDNRVLAQRIEELEQSKRKNLINFEFFRSFFK